MVGVFDLSRPYFGFDTANVFKQVGTVRSRGAEFSISGSVTPRLDVVAGGMLLKPKVTAADTASGNIGSKPVGLPTHLLIANANWKTPAKGLELDLALVHRGAHSGDDRQCGVHPGAGARRYWRSLSLQDRETQLDLPAAAGQPVQQSRLWARRVGRLYLEPEPLFAGLFDGRLLASPPANAGRPGTDAAGQGAPTARA